MLSAQKGKIKNVSQDYESYSYIKTSEVLLKITEKGYKNQEMLKKLANSFYFNNNMKEASRWYSELLKTPNEVDPEYYFRYAMALKGIENYEDSDKWMTKFKEFKTLRLKSSSL